MDKLRKLNVLVHVEHSTLEEVREAALARRRERRIRAASKAGKSVPAEKRPFSTNRELAATAGRKGGQNCPAEKRGFARNPESARNAALRRHELARAAKERADELRDESRAERHESDESYFGVSGLFKGSHL